MNIDQQMELLIPNATQNEKNYYMRGSLDTMMALRRPDGGLTPEEHKIAKLIVEAWNGFVNLKPSHPNDKMEFHRGIHLLQHTLGMRVLRRDYPDYWLDKGGE